MAAKKGRGRRASCSSNEKALMESHQRILEEIATIKEEIRKAYSAQVRETQGYIPSEIEKRMIRDRDIANSVIDRVTESLSKIGVMEPPETSYRPDSTKTFSLLQFFYLVKTCQQQSPGMLSSLYPGMEASALTHLSDTLMDYSLKAAQERDIEVRREYRHKVNTIMDKMTRGLNQPIDKGYTTTYQHILQLLDALTDPEYPGILKEELTPLIPPLSLNPSYYSGPYKLPLPTVPFPKSLLNAYHEKMNIQQHQEKKEKSEDKEITQNKDQKDKERKDLKQKEEKSQNKDQKDKERKDLKQKQEKSPNKDQKEKETVVDDDDDDDDDDNESAVVKEDKTNENDSAAVIKEQGNDQKDDSSLLIEENDTTTKEEDDDEDTRFQDADDDQVIEIKTSILDDQWEDEPSTDLPHTHWESFEQPTRKRRGLRPLHYRRSPNR